MATNPDMDIRCVMDSNFDPMSVLVEDVGCSEAAGDIDQVSEHHAVPDQSCLQQETDANICLE